MDIGVCRGPKHCCWAISPDADLSILFVKNLLEPTLIFDNVISNNGLLGNKLRLLTCHQQAYMKAADRLILLESSSEQVSACEIIENKTPAEAMQEGKTNSKLGNLMYTWEETYATTAEEEDEKQQQHIVTNVD